MMSALFRYNWPNWTFPRFVKEFSSLSSLLTYTHNTFYDEKYSKTKTTHVPTYTAYITCIMHRLMNKRSRARAHMCVTSDHNSNCTTWPIRYTRARSTCKNIYIYTDEASYCAYIKYSERSRARQRKNPERKKNRETKAAGNFLRSDFHANANSTSRARARIPRMSVQRQGKSR